ncbi:bZIP domain containing protein [uncultured Caudovirales phage]|uniref:BZIP domain containing protein n=1 Tax=uncultured Caudovirales phage TaxID=2100421 RepID=A0A6J5Q2Q3_9CAUD|nr:bZIP domain containing protein [uncultured Caudovirales phage]CAB4176897.1 bZIP domain containing protein [uncultured Caudovirales phage]CAB4189911.1 bZIP domain containing protein [uncultured Caudovirales phage]
MSLPAMPDWLQHAFEVGGGVGIAKLWDWWTGRAKFAAEVSKITAETNKTLNDVVDEHLKALLSGYESRIKDLTDEVEGLRAEVKELRKALDARPKPPDTYGL